MIPLALGRNTSYAVEALAVPEQIAAAWELVVGAVEVVWLLLTLSELELSPPPPQALISIVVAAATATNVFRMCIPKYKAGPSRHMRNFSTLPAAKKL